MEKAWKSGAIAKLPIRRILVGVATVAIAGGSLILLHLLPSPREPTTVEQVAPPITTVTALGWLEPRGEVVKLSAPSSAEGNRLEQLLVKQGDRVKAGQVIAILDSRDRLQAAYLEAQTQVKIAQNKLAQVKAGAKSGEIASQKAEIARIVANQKSSVRAQEAVVDRLSAEVQNALTESQRYTSLYQAGAISASQRDSKQLALKTAQRNLQQAQAELSRLQTTGSPDLERAQATLNKIVEVRPVDVEAAQLEIERASAALKQAQAKLEQASIRSSQDGVILDILTRPGEIISSSDGIVEIGRTSDMYAIAEVYESDIKAVHPGQSVQITSESLSTALQGRVDWIDAKVRRQSVVNTDPSSNVDARVVRVHIQLDPASSQKAAQFTNLQIQAQIQLEPQS
ncbi:HlyD family efflux transporter periplasmic adaptor subunit [Scytonema tolypothrichoides VB-61278]|nr:HlyD family efflux transporter periplasmic adaptor subunit [Scytonema tolypothrichoides VB-61278]